ncbi:MAG: protein kinase, partial [Planctomycetaceae bacterium]|nr:protein kinase [Planctomycetaceae bacterium]
MIQRGEPEAVDPDERLGEAIEAYLALAEEGHAPDPEEFAARYPDIGDELRAALDGLALVQGLVGEPSGPGHRLESGRRIAGYRIVRELGRGGMGTVYEAVHVGLDRPVALKVLGHHAAPDSRGRRRFLNEARTAARLHHTHIVPVYDVGQVGGLCYYAMQRIEGSGLDRVLRSLRRDRTTAAGPSQGGSTANRSSTREAAPAKPGDQTVTWGDLGEGGAMARDLAGAGHDQDDEPSPFEPPGGSAYYRWIAEVGLEAAEALAHAHQRGVVHRDIKPSNLLVDARGFVWVADFGLARRLDDPSQTQHDSLLGTPRYMSPEQAGIGPIDGRSDIYSLGATLYELLTLRPPFEGQTAAELVDQITSREPAAPRQFDSRIPRDLETIVLKALAKRREDRYAVATDLADDLGRFLSHEPVRARRIGPLGRLWRFARRHPSLAAVSTAAAAIVVTVAAVAHVRVVDERNQAIAAKNEAQAAMRKIEAANRKTREAMRAQLWREASVVRLSNVANRRVTGLGLLRDAAAMDPDPGLRSRLRDEATEFLVLRDVERGPDFATGPARGLTFDPRGSRLATLSEDGEEFRLWDVATRRCLHAHPLRVGPVPPPPAPVADPATGRPAPAPHRRRGGAPNPVATVGPSVAVVLPEGLGLRFFNATTGAPLHDLELSGRRLLSFLATPDGHRLVTVERSSDLVPGEPNSKVEFQVNLWDPERHDQPVATLSRWESTAAAREMPLIAMAPDVPTVAVARSRKMSVSLWSAGDGRSLGTIETQAELSAVALGHSGLLATAGGGAVRLWDLDARTSLPGLDSHLSFVRTLRFNPKGTLLAVAGIGSDIEVWDVASRTVVAELPTPDRVEDLAFAPGGHLLAAATAGASTAAWTVLDPFARVQLSGFEQPPTSLAFRGDDLLAMATRRGSIRFWRPGHCLSLTPQSDAPPSDGLARDEPTALIFDGGDRLITLDTQAL